MTLRIRTLVGCVIVALLVLAGCSSSSEAPVEQAAVDASADSDEVTTPSPTEAPAATPTQVPAELPDEVAMNHVQVMGSHNSYHLRPPTPIFSVLQGLSPELAAAREYEHAPLREQLDTYGIRQLEIDVYADPDGGLYSAPAVNALVGLSALDDPQLASPGYKVLHIQDYDYATTCLTLISCLGEVADWSQSRPDHLPVVIMIEFKSESVPDSAANEGIELPALAWTTPLGPTEELLDDLDAEIRSVFSPDQLVAPDDVRNGADTLDAAVTNTGWPALDDSRGKVMFTLIGGPELRDFYTADSPSLQGRAMFTNSTPGDADAAFMLIDDPTDGRLDSMVQAGYLVRTRTDVPTGDARNNDRTRLDAALAGGAHFLSTDYYRPSELFDSPYVAALPGQVTARCNPVVAPPTCTDSQLAEAAPPPTPAPEPVDLASYSWQRIADDAPWGGRAGLRVLEFDESLFLLGGRTPRQSTLPGDSDIWADVWRSDDLGATWQQVVANDADQHWPARAYFQAVMHNDSLLVIGGQDYGLMENPFCALIEQGLKPPPGLGIDPDAPCPEFLPTSNFFNDVWSSTDGVAWTQLTAEAPWDPRAGLSAVSLGDYLYVLAGSQNDDASIIGANGPARLYYNDVWRSTDGTDWQLMTEAAPWEPRAGASVVAFDDALWLFGGEDGFTCTPLPDCDPPYFNDVWRSTDGAVWEEVSPAAAWSKRPGHQCEIVGVAFVCFGGFGLIENPADVQASTDGVSWTLLDEPAWNVDDQAQVKYDFDSITVEGADGPIIMTFGGDRETFDFDDPENYLRVDDDVWMFAPTG